MLVATTSEKYLDLSELVKIAMNIFQKFYKTIFGDRPKFEGNSRPSLGNNNFISLLQRRDDPDLDEIPFRDSRRARELMNFVNHNPEVDAVDQPVRKPDRLVVGVALVDLIRQQDFLSEQVRPIQ